MDMYPKKDLYKLYRDNLEENEFSKLIPDVTKKRTLEIMNIAVNCCEDWNHAVDIGGGSGHYSIPLLHKFKNVTLIEPDFLENQNVLKNKYNNFSVINKFIEDIPPEKNVDLILLADVFEHIPNINSFIKKLTLMQDVGGIIYILTPNPLFCGPAIKSGLHHSISGSHGHIRHYFKSEVEKILIQNNYLLTHHSYEESPVRAFIRIMMRGLSRRDKKWSEHFLYRIFIGPLFRLFLKPFMYVCEFYIYGAEYKSRNDSEKCMSSVFIFKKL